MQTRVRYRIDFQDNQWYSEPKDVKRDVQNLKKKHVHPLIYEVTETIDNNGLTNPIKEKRVEEEEL